MPDAGVIDNGPQPMAIDECPGSVAADLVQRLQDPNLKPGSSRWLYPYERTVFPRGLTAPVLQWEMPAFQPTAVFIHLQSTFLDYRLCLPLAEPMRIQIPQNAWDLAAAQSRGKPDPLLVDVVLAGAQNASRMPPLTLVFALADLKGAVYYNTYGSVLASNMGIGGGVVMRVLPSAAKPPEVFLSARGTPDQCIGCHSVSADGSRMVAEVHEGGGILEGASRSFDLTAAGTATEPAPLRDNLKRAGFSGIYPDGSLYVTTARLFPGPGPVDNPPDGIGNITGTFGPEESKLFDTNSGTEIPNSGVHPYAFMPTFSVDGRMLVFNKVDSASTTDGGRVLAVMDFDRAQNRFSNPREIYRNGAGLFPSWPFFLPDVVLDRDENTVAFGKRVVFALVSNNDLLTAAALPPFNPPKGDLWWVDVDTGMAAALQRANGSDNGNVYLPYGAAEASLNFVPTVSPVAAGGYFWVFFTSKRNYGNIRVASAFDDASAKKIWVAALDIEGAPGSDPSHPAFYLPNQELESGNIRAFAALEPCRAEGASCHSGVDCCCGYCIKPDQAAAEGACGCEPQRCSAIDEKCNTAADCCTPGAACVGGFCQLVVE